MILFYFIVFDMFRTTKCSSSGRLVYAVLWYLFTHHYKQSGRCGHRPELQLFFEYTQKNSKLFAVA